MTSSSIIDFYMKKFLLFFLGVFLMAQCTQKTPEKENVAEPFDVAAEIQTDPVIDSLTQFIAQNATDAQAFAARARRFLALRNFGSAINDADLAIALDSNNTFAQLVRGEVYYITNKTRISQAAWTKCIQLDAKNIECRLKLAELYNAVESYRQSLKLTNEVIELNPQIAEAFFMKGLNIVGLYGDTVQAMPYLQKAIELDQNYLKALDLLGVWLTERKDPLALAYLMRASEINPTAESLYKIGFYYKEMDDFEKAADHLSQAIQLDPKHVNAHFLLGYVMVELGEYEEALEAFSTCLSIREINHKAYYGRGYTHELMGNFDAARQDFAEALRKNPEHQPSQDGIRRLQTRR